jgi:hypothetical protein
MVANTPQGILQRNAPMSNMVVFCAKNVMNTNPVINTKFTSITFRCPYFCVKYPFSRAPIKFPTDWMSPIPVIHGVVSCQPEAAVYSPYFFWNIGYP